MKRYVDVSSEAVARSLINARVPGGVLPEKRFSPKSHQHVLVFDANNAKGAESSVLLASNGFPVRRVESLEDASEALLNGKIRCVIISLADAEKEAAELIRIVRLSTKTQYLPIIVLAPETHEADLELLLDGADVLCPEQEVEKLLAAQVELLLN